MSAILRLTGAAAGEGVCGPAVQTTVSSLVRLYSYFNTSVLLTDPGSKARWQSCKIRLCLVLFIYFCSLFCVALYKAGKSHNRCLWDYNGNVAEGGADEASAQRGALKQRGFRSPRFSRLNLLPCIFIRKSF